MSAVTFQIDYTDPRNKKTNALRVFYALPHIIIVNALGYLAEALAVVQWFIILFTGKRNQSIWSLGRGVLDWQARVYTYTGLMYDTYPNFGFEKGAEPVTFALEFEAEANRLTSALRIIWAIPAVVVMAVIGIAGFLVTVVTWFAIVFTGTQSRGSFDFLLKVHRLGVRTNAYVLLLTDTYPKYE